MGDSLSFLILSWHELKFGAINQLYKWYLSIQVSIKFTTFDSPKLKQPVMNDLQL